MTRRPLALVPLAAVAFAMALSACTPLGTLLGPGATSPAPQPTRTAAVPIPLHTSTALPTVGATGCTLTTAGSYQVADCDVLQIAGNGITVAAGAVGSVVVRGDRAQVLAASAGSVQIEGQDDLVAVGGDIGTISIAGDRDEIDARGRIGSGRITGNDDILKAPGGVGAITDDGARNTIPTS